ncbi:MAG: hypothetical protein HW421_383 [Ignavibacteria bacterium]|nr:hypothetical protein [Ignavibacteria bacterium]
MKNKISNYFKYLFIITVIVIIAGLPARAAYMKAIPMTLSQPDGTTLNLFATGDEYYNWLHDADGYTIIQHPQTGYFTYAVLNDGGDIVSSQNIVGRVDPNSLGIQKWLTISAEKMMQRRSLFDMPAKPIANKKKDMPQVANIGTIQNLAIFIGFSNFGYSGTGYEDRLSVYNSQFNATDAVSMAYYFKEVSYQKLQINTYFYPATSGSICLFYRDPNPRSYYSPYSGVNTIGYTNDAQRTSREHTLLRNAVNYIASQVPASLNIDNDNDGFVDNVCFFIAGTNDAWATLLWPHRWALYTQTAMINGKRVWDFNFQIQSWVTQSRAVSVLCHEMFHSLGAPDLYHYVGNGIQPADGWDLMENDATQHMTAFMKYKYGHWINNIPEITEPGTYTLNPLTSSERNCYKIKSPNDPNQYFMVEYRVKTGLLERNIPGTGMLVYRIDPTAGNGNASGPPDELYIYRPNGTTTANGTPSQANFSAASGRTAINSTTNPTPFLQDGSPGGINIFGVGAAGQTISFNITFPLSTPVLFEPFDGDTVVNVVPTFKWFSVQHATYYVMQLSDMADFSNIIYETPKMPYLIQLYPYKLDTRTNYYFRVKAYHLFDSSEWSTPYSFKSAFDPPEIVSQTPNAIICKNESVHFYVTATGSYLKFQWQKDGVDITGQTTPKLDFTAGTFDVSAVYRCRVTNFPFRDTLYSRNMVVYVASDPEITKPPSQLIWAALGDTVRITFGAHIQGLPPEYQPEILWYRGTKPLTDDLRFIGTTSNALSIRGIKATDYGNDYYFILKSQCGWDTSFKITIGIPPGITVTKQPADISSCEGSSATFGVTAAPTNGGQTILYQWYINDIALAENPMSFTGTNTAVLTALNLTINSGSNNIYCIMTVQPGGAKVKSNVVKLTIKEMPAITLQPANTITEKTGNPISFIVGATGFAPLTHQWYKDGTSLTSQTTATLSIAAVATADQGKYWCIVTNQCGSVTSDTSTLVVTVLIEQSDVKDSYIASLIKLENVPNPFEDITEISWSNLTTSNVKLVICDIMGNKISTLIDEQLMAGRHKVQFNATAAGIMQGIYYYTLYLDGRAFTGKMIYLR